MRILYVVNNAAFFCSHRLPLALAARRFGHEVGLVTGQAGSPTLEAMAKAQLQAAGVPHRALAFRSAGRSPWSEVRGLASLILHMLRWKPDLVHCASPKGVLYGGIAARLARRRALVLAISGMGSLFTGQGSSAQRWLRRAYLALVRFAFGHPHSHTIVQNEDDRRFALEQRLAREPGLSLIPGSGVALDRYRCDDSRREPLVVLPARMLGDKGVVEFVEAARRLKTGGCAWRFVLVGVADYDNPTAIAAHQLRAWQDEGCVQWWGHVEDMPDLLARASIVCLPSYREGLPKALIEAAAAGCAVVTTRTVGCREAVIEGRTADLVPVRNAQALAHTLAGLIEDAPRRAAYGAAGRRLAQERFSIEAVVQTTLAIYAGLEPGGRGG